eukprot:TRINITY_DN3198_c0_g1_i1.p1 TRINITY_DN3198_c0_g1~~TRINITY_DN3198_c0_g1_i1.p1  ORF type:complete len:806 (+),score=157.01 TRINITY_DN3198_c0_g1_i1:98-2515(+)
MSNEKKKKKKLNAPQKKSSAASRQQPAIQKELMKYTQLKDIKNVKETFMKWCEEDTKMGDLIPTQVLSVYDNKLKDSEVADHMNDIRKIHEGGITKTGQTKEATLSMMVRLACKSGLPQEAMKYFQQIPKEKPTGSTDRITPRFRSIIPLLKAYAVMGDIDRCFSFFESELLQLKRTGVLTEKEAIQWEDSCGILLRCVAASKLTEAEKKSKIETVFAQLFSVVPVLHPNGKQKDVILDVATSCNCIPHPKVRVTNGGVAIFPATDPNPNDNVSLSSSTLQKSELEELQALTEQLALEGVPEVFHQQWFHFKKNLLNSNINYKSIIDAANVGHTAQNVSGGAFSHQQIDAVAASVDNPLIVLREHWLRGTTELEVKKKKKKKLPQLKNKKLKCDDPVEAKPCDNNEEEEEEEEESKYCLAEFTSSQERRPQTRHFSSNRVACVRNYVPGKSQRINYWRKHFATYADLFDLPTKSVPKPLGSRVEKLNLSPSVKNQLMLRTIFPDIANRLQEAENDGVIGETKPPLETDTDRLETERVSRVFDDVRKDVCVDPSLLEKYFRSPTDPPAIILFVRAGCRFAGSLIRSNTTYKRLTLRAFLTRGSDRNDVTYREKVTYSRYKRRMKGNRKVYVHWRSAVFAIVNGRLVTDHGLSGDVKMPELQPDDEMVPRCVTGVYNPEYRCVSRDLRFATMSQQELDACESELPVPKKRFLTPLYEPHRKPLENGSTTWKSKETDLKDSKITLVGDPTISPDDSFYTLVIQVPDTVFDKAPQECDLLRISKSEELTSGLLAYREWFQPPASVADDE